MPAIGNVRHLRATFTDAVVYNGIAKRGLLSQTMMLHDSDNGGPIQIRQTTLTVAAADFPNGFTQGRTISVNSKSYRIDRVDPESEQDTVLETDGNVAVELWLARMP